MSEETEIWVRVLQRELDNAEVRQTLAIVQAEPLRFRIVQEYELKRARSNGRLSLVKSSVSFRGNVFYATRDSAIEQAKCLVNEYCSDGWRICCTGSMDGDTIANYAEG